MCSNRASLSQTDLLVFHWSCRKSELRGPVGGERLAVSKATVGLVTEHKAAPTTPGTAWSARSGCFKGGWTQRAGSQASEMV